MDEILSILKNDSQSELALKVCYPYSVDSTLKFEKLSRDISNSIDWQLQEDPPFISVALFYQSNRCFNLLLSQGANLMKKDKKGVPFYF